MAGNYLKSTNRKAGTNQCAEFANCKLNNLGYWSYGNAWDRDGDIIYNGYANIKEKPTDPIQYGRLASADILKNFNSKTQLDPDSTYTVNMYYAGSPFAKEAALDTDGNGIIGTHTGNLYFDQDTGRWMVEHNIHGTVYNDDFISLQGGKGAYGVTAIQLPRPITFGQKIKKRFKELFFNKQGGKINYITFFKNK